LRWVPKALLLLAPLAAGAQQAAHEAAIQRALIQRDQQSADFAAQIRGGEEARRQMELLHAQQLRENPRPGTPRELMPYERQRLSSESDNVLRLTPPVTRPSADALLKPLPLPRGPRPAVEPVAPPSLGG